MKIEQQVGGSAPNQDDYTGEARQLTVDTDNWDLRLHDGVTEGGRLLINRDNGDERWQAKSAELDGFSFPPEARGYVTRLGTGNYKIRRLTVNTNQFDITNADGYNGNPLLALKETITTSHIFTGDIEIEGNLVVGTNITGNTFGIHTGDVVGDVTGNVTGNLTGNAAGNHTGTFTGDVDVSADTITFADDQIPLSALDGLGDFVVAQSIPNGIICMWSGLVDAIPNGWVLCNGLNGTPDLTNRFIVGAGGVSYDPGDSGGSATHSHSTSISSAGDHSHSISVGAHALTENEIPAHKHSNGIGDNESAFFNRGNIAASPASTKNPQSDSASGTIEGWTSTVGGGAGHTHNGSSSSAGSHTHSVNNPSASSLPPYYALCFIMRVVT